jgi:hypothetical protein
MLVAAVTLVAFAVDLNHLRPLGLR